MGGWENIEIVQRYAHLVTRTHDFRESGFYIAVDDVQYPEWRVMFFPQKGDFNSQEGTRDTELQLKRWMHIFDKVINR